MTALRFLVTSSETVVSASAFRRSMVTPLMASVMELLELVTSTPSMVIDASLPATTSRALREAAVPISPSLSKDRVVSSDPPAFLTAI